MHGMGVMRKYLGVAALLLTSAAVAKPVSFTWDVPTEREDGSTLFTNEINGYTIYEDGEKLIYVSGGATTSATVDYDAYGQPCYSISTTDNWQQEGRQSAEVCVNVFPAPPSAPVFLDTSS